MFDLELERKNLDAILLEIYHHQIVMRYELQLRVNDLKDSIVVDVYNRIINSLDDSIKKYEIRNRTII
jgi:uncharacterized protein YqeY